MKLEDFEKDLSKYFNLEELDVRSEVEDFINGDDFGHQKFMPLLARKVRLDTSYHAIKCTCWNMVSQEGTTGCPYCDGMGRLWDEFLFKGMIFTISSRQHINLHGYNRETGRNDDYTIYLFTEHGLNLNDGDKIYQLGMTEDGFIREPVYREYEYLVIDDSDVRLDYGQSEYERYFLRKINEND